MLVSLMESSNPKLGKYMKAVAQLAGELAADAGLSNTDQAQIEMAGLVHDIGLLGLPEAIVEKPIKSMGPEEFESYRQHPMIAALSLSSVSRLRAVSDIVRSHHENIDGTGFPEGLRGDRISAGASILALAADYLTMVHLWPQPIHRFLSCARRYLDAEVIRAVDISDDGIREYLAEKIVAQNAGKRYDPAYVRLLLKRKEAFSGYSASAAGGSEGGHGPDAGFAAFRRALAAEQRQRAQ